MMDYRHGSDEPWSGHDASSKPALVSVRLPKIDIVRIPPRRWAYGRFLLFGKTAALAAVDGGGKGAMAVAIVLSFITGRGLLGENVWRQGPVAIITYEDDTEEWHRRIAAACIYYGANYDDVLDHITFIAHRTGRASASRRWGQDKGPCSRTATRSSGCSVRSAQSYWLSTRSTSLTASKTATTTS